jgi:hypothetical protein
MNRRNHTGETPSVPSVNVTSLSLVIAQKIVRDYRSQVSSLGLLGIGRPGLGGNQAPSPVGPDLAFRLSPYSLWSVCSRTDISYAVYRPSVHLPGPRMPGTTSRIWEIHISGLGRAKRQEARHFRTRHRLDCKRVFWIQDRSRMGKLILIR